MGLDCSHDAFHGAYSSFNRFRQAVAKATGGSFPPHAVDEIDGEKLDPEYWYWGDDYKVGTHPGLNAFLAHSDCDGKIGPFICAKLAKELEALLPEIDKQGMGGGHIESAGGYGSVTRRFISGCMLAAENNEPLEFC